MKIKANELCAHDYLLESYYASSIAVRENFINTIFRTKHTVSTNVNYGYSQYFIAFQVPKCETLRSKERNTPTTTTSPNPQSQSWLNSNPPYYLW